MTRTEQQIRNLERTRSDLAAERTTRVSKHRDRSDVDRKLRAVTTKAIRLENALHKASRRRQTSHGLTLPGDGGSPDAVGVNNA